MCNITNSRKQLQETENNSVITNSFNCGLVSFDFYDNNALMFKVDNLNINWFFCGGKTKDGRIFSSKTATLNSYHIKAIKNGYIISLSYFENDITFIQHLTTDFNNPFFIAQLEVIDQKDIIEINQLTVLDFEANQEVSLPLFADLKTKLLICSSDNTYYLDKTDSLKKQLTSYDISAIFNPSNLNGLVIGSIDNNVWKNGIEYTENPRNFKCLSGITKNHPHGYLKGNSIISDRFFCGYFKDVREGLIYYGKLAQNKNGIHNYNKEKPFVYNPYNISMVNISLNYHKQAANFFNKQLSEFSDSNNTFFINIDGQLNFSKLRLKNMINKLHKQNIKVGTSLSPLAFKEENSMIVLKGAFLKFNKDIALKKSDDSIYPAINGKIPIDITIPEAENSFRLQLKEIIDLGFDYIKFEDLSYGDIEAIRYDKNIATGRQALNHFYQILKEELDPIKIGREIFVEFSNSPLFPCNYAHARRNNFKEIKELLNALTYSFYNNNLYQFSSFNQLIFKNLIKEKSTNQDILAKSLYNISIISGSLLVLADNLEFDDNAQNKLFNEKLSQLANNENINKIARINKAFLPLSFQKDNHLFYLNYQGHTYGAIFNLETDTKTFKINPKAFNFNTSGLFVDLNNNISTNFDDEICLTLEGYDSIIFELIKN